MSTLPLLLGTDPIDLTESTTPPPPPLPHLLPPLIDLTEAPTPPPPPLPHPVPPPDRCIQLPLPPLLPTPLPFKNQPGRRESTPRKRRRITARMSTGGHAPLPQLPGPSRIYSSSSSSSASSFG
jgi:hypothetical protein